MGGADSHRIWRLPISTASLPYPLQSFSMNQILNLLFPLLLAASPSIVVADWANDWTYANPSTTFRFDIERLGDGPIIHPSLPTASGGVGGYGTNINGPSLIRVPDWVEKPLGKYYLYFAHHQGSFIRMAYADELTGPWTVKSTDLAVNNTFGVEHIASPDVHIDHEEQQIRMYYHSPAAEGSGHSGQVTWAALSGDGLSFQPREEVLGSFYFRVFEHDGWHYAFAKRGEVSNVLYRSRDGLTDFEEGPFVLPSARHTALWRHDDDLYVFFSRTGDSPEHIMVTRVENLDDDWTKWTFTTPQTVIIPEFAWEGVNEPIEPSKRGAIHHPVHQLRDPGIFVEDDQLYLLYSVAGERGIAIAKLNLVTQVPEPTSAILIPGAVVALVVCRRLARNLRMDKAPTTN